MKTKYSVTDAAKISKVPADQIERFISYSWILVADDSEPSLDHEDIARIRLIRELQDDFGINNEAIPIVLKLIDQLNGIHRMAREAL